ncbi:MAG: polysaccharide biosynthesis tyrosine autokinase [Bacteroidota bacterium]|nr:polysaccharide biosynthesis tyrosine autokinase [Bacteroidota bacterium]
MDPQNNTTTDSFSDVKNILSKVARNWYFFVLALVIAFSAAFFLIRYTEEVYPVEAHILIKSNTSGAGSAAELLYGNQIFETPKSTNTEAVMLKSYPLINKVIKSLDFDKQFLEEGKIVTSEVYEDAPAKILYDTSSTSLPYNRKFDFIVVDENNFSFYESEDEENKNVKKGLYPFNEEIDYKGFRFTAFKRTGFNLKKVAGRRYIFRIVNPYNLTNSYRSRLLVMPMIEDPSVLRVSLNGKIPQKEIDFISKLIELYRQEEVRKKNLMASKTINFIDSQLKNITDSLNFIESKLEMFRVNKKVSTDISEDGRRHYQQLELLEGERAKLTADLSYFNYLTNYVQNNQDGGDLMIPSAANINDPVLNGFLNEFVQMQVQRRTLQINSPKNPTIPALTQSIARLKSNIIESVNNLRGSTQFKKNELDRRISQIESGIKSLPGAQRQFVDIQRHNDLSESLYLLYTQKRAEAAISQASTSSDISIVNPPMLAGGPIEPDTKRIYMVAFFLGISIPLGFILIGTYLNNKVQYKEDIEKLTTIPLLGQIWRKAKGGNLVVSQAPKSAVAESFRSIRSNLNFFTSGKEKKVFLITSSISGEGKTFCALNLSTVFSFSGKPTLLIGADLRKPRIFNDLGLSNDVGLSSYLSNTAKLSQVIQRSEIANLDVICSGPIPPNPSELLMEEKMRLLMNELKNMYDYIIIDTAPLGLVTDAYVLMEHVDHTIYLVRQDYSTQDTLRQVQEVYANGKLKKVSILFNDVKLKKNKNGYGYYEETK